MKSPFDIVRRVPRFSSFLLKKPRLPVKVLEHYARERLSQAPMIRAIEYAVTYDCQASCAKCSAVKMKDPGREKLTPAQLRQLGDDCFRLGNYEVNFTGGEPLLADDLEDIVTYFHPEASFVGVNTNGALLDRRRLVALRDAGVDVIKISLDSPVPEEHDASRGIDGLYHHIFDVLRQIREIRGLRGHLCMVTTREAVERGQVRQVLDLADAHDATMGLVFPASIGGWSRKHEVLLSEEHRRALQGFADEPRVFLQGNVGQKGFVCPCGTSEIYITCYGDVIPCPFIQIAFGNVGEEGFDAIYRRMSTWKTKNTDATVCSSAEDRRFVKEYVAPIQACDVTPVRHDQHPAFQGGPADPPDPAR